MTGDLWLGRLRIFWKITAQPKRLVDWINTCMSNVRLTWSGTTTWGQVRDAGMYVPRCTWSEPRGIPATIDLAKYGEDKCGLPRKSNHQPPVWVLVTKLGGLPLHTCIYYCSFCYLGTCWVIAPRRLLACRPGYPGSATEVSVRFRLVC